MHILEQCLEVLISLVFVGHGLDVFVFDHGAAVHSSKLPVGSNRYG